MINSDSSILSSLTDYWDVFMPAPQSTLLKGLTLGLDDLSQVPEFKQKLINTGTIHVAVVSGYNISLVLNICQTVIGNRVTLRHTLLYIVLSLIYALATGFEPPIVRAWLMSSILLVAKLSGRSVQGVYVLCFTCILMILTNKSLLTSYSFVLSSGATLGLLLYSTGINKMMTKYVRVLPNMFISDLSASLAASIIVTPFIVFAFSRISIFSPLINMVLLWTIPISTILGFLTVFTSFIDIYMHTQFAPFVFFVCYPFLTIFVYGIDFMGKYEFISSQTNLSATKLICYYLLLVVLTVIFSRRSRGLKCQEKI
ncbi:ComEC/Rec2 family competence protein [candidate division WWE3 bacterium]|uniref:ComEC/Rec2 family competence protein n=1 Tax=candidate division WWE3 bacterium TaxID=2053526 RepID=A0A7X9DJY4_UNCKA|nr:ComEC/Rec2 family competence protein [candidate division WWE3 bacterium]